MLIPFEEEIRPMSSPTSQGRWVLQEAQGISPSPRGGLAAVAIGSRVICFGGSDRKPTVFDDVWCLETSGDGKELALEWVKITPSFKNGCKITPRSGASLTAVNGKLYLYGGQEPMTETRYGEIYCLDPEMWEWSLVETRGTTPPARHSHVACSLAGQCLLIHGGSGMCGSLGDVCIFNTEQSSWSLIPEMNGPSPSPREMHCGCLVDKDQSLLVYGGRDSEGKILCDAAVLDVKEMKWKSIEPTPFSRCAHTIVSLKAPSEELKAEAETLVFIYGGFSGEAVEGDVLKIDPGSLEIEVVRRGPRETDAPRSVPQPRFAHAAVSLVAPGGGGDVMLVLGGVNQAADLIDLAYWAPQAAPV